MIASCRGLLVAARFSDKCLLGMHLHLPTVPIGRTLWAQRAIPTGTAKSKNLFVAFPVILRGRVPGRTGNGLRVEIDGKAALRKGVLSPGFLRHLGKERA